MHRFHREFPFRGACSSLRVRHHCIPASRVSAFVSRVIDLVTAIVALCEISRS